MKKMICFDMDGTIADLYGVENWLEMLENENPFPYKAAKPMWDMVELAAVLNELRKIGYEICIVTWLAKDSTEAYKDEVRAAKRAWLDAYGFPYDRFHGVAYGATKANSIRKNAETAILFDDNEKVRKGWHMGGAIDPTAIDIVEYLKELLGE